jgi:hypothetical protein
MHSSKALYLILLFSLLGPVCLAQRDTLTQIRFPYRPGYYQFFQGIRQIGTSEDTPNSPIALNIQFEQAITESIDKATVKWHQFKTTSKVGDSGMEGYYFISVNQNLVYRWHAGPEWNTLMIPAALYTGLYWKYQHKGQKFKATVIQTDTLINTAFGSHRCFAIRTETRKMYYNGKKAESVTIDYYDSLIGKVQSVSAIRHTKGKALIYTENMMLTEYRQDD